MSQDNKENNFFPVVVMSDIHIGSRYSQVKKATKFLKSISCKKLILNGDIVDGWQIIKHLRTWSDEFTMFFEEVIRKAQEEKTEIIYLMGNHDDFFINIAPITYEKINILKSYIFTDINNKKYFVFHGDRLDKTSVHRKWLANLGDTWYHYMLRINKIYNSYRKVRNKKPLSFTQNLKTWAKSFFSDGSKFNKKIIELAKEKEVDAVICGHTHVSHNGHIDNILYLNSGDWMESLTALAQNTIGEWLVWNDIENKWTTSN